VNISLLLEMAADAFPARVAVGTRTEGITYAGLLDAARRGASVIASRQVERVGLVDMSSVAQPILLFASALAGRVFTPVNYRLADDRLRALTARTAPALFVAGPHDAGRIGGLDGVEVLAREAFLDALGQYPAAENDADITGEEVAVWIFTSGTTGTPKAAVLRQRHLFSYVTATGELGAAGADEAALVSVPPYHIAGVAAVLSSVYAGRRLVYLPSYSAQGWVELARAESITHAMVVPTMLAGILDTLERSGESLPALRSLSYGGGKMPVALVERALAMLPETSFVNGYGLTETSSTITLLSPDDHRAAAASLDPVVRRRLGSVGRALPHIELVVRDVAGRRVPAGVPGEVWVRGEHIAGEYAEGTVLTGDHWFRTNDGGWLDDDGYLFIEGRLDDVIVRGGENISPAEIEQAIMSHPAVEQVAVCAVPDENWGEVPAAFVVTRAGHDLAPGEVRDWVRARLRSTRVPGYVEFVPELPYNELGKLLRRTLQARFADERPAARLAPVGGGPLLQEGAGPLGRFAGDLAFGGDVVNDLLGLPRVQVLQVQPGRVLDRHQRCPLLGRDDPGQRLGHRVQLGPGHGPLQEPGRQHLPGAVPGSGEDHFPDQPDRQVQPA
jgi:fatty-acyl-CoA synthase